MKQINPDILEKTHAVSFKFDNIKHVIHNELF